MWRFSIRELMLLTIIVAISVMWRLDRGRLEESSAALQRENRQLEAEGQALQRKVQPLLLSSSTKACCSTPRSSDRSLMAGFRRKTTDQK